jgi:hypothetical protein
MGINRQLSSNMSPCFTMFYPLDPEIVIAMFAILVEFDIEIYVVKSVLGYLELGSTRPG